jgi:hypothetical protein
MGEDACIGSDTDSEDDTDGKKGSTEDVLGD